MRKAVFYNVYYLERRTDRRGVPYWKVVGADARRHPRDESSSYIVGFVSRSAKNRWNVYKLMGHSVRAVTKKQSAAKALKALKVAAA